MIQMTNFKSMSNNTNSKHYKSFDIFLMRGVKLCLLICSFAYLLVYLLPKSVYAQSLSLSIWPPLLEVMIQPGRSVTQAYEIANHSEYDLKVTPSIIPFKPANNEGQISLQWENKNFPNFFSFETGEILNTPFWLKSGQTKQVLLKISPPKDLSEKDYYFTLLFSANPVSPSEKNTSSSSTIEVGTNILISVSQSGNPKLFGKISEFSCPKVIDSFSPVNFNLKVENWGKTFWKPFGKIFITGFLGQKEEIEILPQNVLAESERKIFVPSFKPKLPLGPFKAKVEFSLNQEGPVKLESQISFWYLPYKILIPLLFVIFFFFLFKKFRPKK